MTRYSQRRVPTLRAICCASGGNPMPDEQHDDRADRRADQAGPFIEPIPADRLTDEGRDEMRPRCPERK